MFMFTDYTQKIDVDIQVYNEDVNAFALFGFNLKTNVIKDSLVNISLNFEVFHGALVCIICDVEIYNCSLIFVASGKQLSGLVGEALNSVFLQQSLVQYRLTSLNASGVVNQIRNANANITIVDCKMAGSNLIESGYSGFIACEIVKPMNIIISSFVVCVDNIKSLGNQSFVFSINGTINYSCDVCGVQKVIYGLCGDNLQYAVEHNGMMTCDSPFEYLDNQCKCMYGYLRDGSICVDVIDAIHQSSQTMQNNNIINELLTNLSNIELHIEQLNDSILSNSNYIYGVMQNNSIILEEYILSNISKLQNFTQGKISLLENRILGNISDLSNQSKNNLAQIENYILGNFSGLNNILETNITTLNNSIIIINNEIQLLNNTIQNISLKINQNIANFNNSIIQMDNQVSTINSTMTTSIENMQQSLEDSNIVIDQQQSIIEVLMIQAQCLNLEQSHYTNNNECIVKYSINYSDDSLSCNQNIYVSVYDVVSVTNQVSSSSNFSSGYVFSNSKVIKNAFIDVSDGVYSTVQPLFQNQSIFNNIKIQIGTQTVSSGSILTTSSSIVVNLMNIVSKTGCFITVGPSQLNILIQSSSSVSIINLLINLSFATSDGNITLINNIGGVLNISGYQIIGQYQSSKTVTMIGRSISSTSSYIRLVSFNPDLYNVGPDSSYLLGYAVDSTFNIQGIAIVLGNNTNYQIATTSLSILYPFGGIITNMGSSTQVTIQKVILNCYQKFNTDQLTNFGFLVGQSSMVATTLYISNVCFQQVADCTRATTKVYYSGLIGQAYGTVSLQSLSLQLSIPAVFIQYVGIVGMLNSNCPIVEVINMKASVNVSSTSNRYLGALFGYQTGKNCTVLNTSISNSSLSSATFVGGIIGYVQSINQTIYNTTLFQSNVTGTATYIGGFVGQCYSTKLTITSSTISSIRVTGTTSLGIIIGGQSGTGNTQTITSSASIGSNYANAVLLANCVSLTNALVQKGC
ncbi:Hypothetical_protein [Hexamita inflata]|uniref:Hypothetical_protein n=1 Tax=Hexamita inflata TaxID=28002 RepID=A0AA86U2N7_9EUKA|nr:Hypothetical protein HINF_LOCUS16488 [Hexamita inflata]